MQMIDENAYGFLFSYFEIEDDEYALEPAEFIARFQLFRAEVTAGLAEQAPSERYQVLELGHAVYVELAEGDELHDPFGWAKRMRERLEAAELRCVAVLSHGSRWVPEPEPDDEGQPSAEQAPGSGVGGGVPCAFPSEPLRRALYAETASHSGEDEELEPGWGPGLYVDTEAIESMGKKLKNAPTPLSVAGATFFRFGS